jgi:hypothetical protein
VAAAEAAAAAAAAAALLTPLCKWENKGWGGGVWKSDGHTFMQCQYVCWKPKSSSHLVNRC